MKHYSGSKRLPKFNRFFFVHRYIFGKMQNTMYIGLCTGLW